MLELVGRGRAGRGTNQERQEEETTALREKLNQGRETKRQTTGEAVRRLQADQQSRQKELAGLEGHPAEQDQAGDLIELIDLTDLSELV